ncbi:hypothetical protein [Bacteroides sp.]|uniref:hypothetical protein n=1 Tax=Bacteroides sp. TaxID=29523 RepID=UPI00260340AA|nr:hypothetical protein [Bacteroides sp.]
MLNCVQSLQDICEYIDIIQILRSNTPDEELQADYMRDFLITVYSHPVFLPLYKYFPDKLQWSKEWVVEED